MTEPDRHVLVAVAWPYANGLQHLGHIGGCYLPADIFARYHRTAGHRVLMVSGSDAHGTPITVKADQEGVAPRDVVERYHPRILEQWDRLGISFDLFTTTMTDNHREVAWDVFRRLRDNGYLDTQVTDQFYDPEAERFLPDRYVEGTCPHCGYAAARGDQCENCGRTLDAEELIDPHSRLTGARPVLRATEHYFMRLPKLQEPLLAWLESRTGWRPHVINWALGFTREGLRDRAITRDLTWGVPLPPEAAAIGDDKRIYVWFEAVIGYLSAAKEWAQRSGDPDAWRAWWQGPAAETYYFIGKDNIDFHAVFWPAILLGYNGGTESGDGALRLATNVPANQYITSKGAKASKSAGVGRLLLDYLDVFEPDALRYALASNLPEYADVDLTDDELVRRVNDELVATWGNLVNRVLAMTARYFDSVVPEPGELDDRDKGLLATVDRLLAEEAQLLEKVELRAGLRHAMEAAQAVNGYLNQTEPWATAKTDRGRTATTLWVALQAVDAVKLGLSPYTPFTAQRLHRLLGHDGDVVDQGWRRAEVAAGAALGGAEPLFAKMDPPAADETGALEGAGEDPAQEPGA